MRKLAFATVTAGFALCSMLLTAPDAHAQQSACADCHFAQPEPPAPDHVADWDNSAHGRSNVGCEKCHGGDPTTFESLPAHRTILNSSNPASPVNRQNLPRTCGACHTGPFGAFQKSQHFALLEKGDAKVPVCVTCHGAAGFARPSARTLETQCAECHGPKGIAPRPERAEGARAMYDGLHESRELLKTAKQLIARVNDRTRRTQLEDAYQQAEVPLTQAVQSGHEFVYNTLRTRLATARQRLEALFAEIANPKPQATQR